MQNGKPPTAVLTENLMKKIATMFLFTLALAACAFAAQGQYQPTNDPYIRWKVENNYTLYLQNNYGEPRHPELLHRWNCHPRPGRRRHRLQLSRT